MDDLKAILDAATPGPWAYRSRKYDDWGTVRSGSFFICQAKDPRYLDDEYLDVCRKTKCDPWETNARLIAMAPDLAAEVLRLREALGLYANPQNWKMSGPCDPNGPNFIGEEHARAALQTERK